MADCYALVIAPVAAPAIGHFGNPRFRICPRRSRSIAHHRWDAETEFERGQIAVELFAQASQSVDPFPQPVERLSPEQLNIRFGGRYFLRHLRCSAEIELWVGHANIETTLNVYGHLPEEAEAGPREALGLLGRLDRATPSLIAAE